MKKTAIRKVSKRLSSGLAKYNKTKLEFLDGKVACDRCCRHAILDLHHRKGRMGSLLLDKKNFAALCQICHTWVHMNPKQARDEGWMLDRLAINNGCYE